MHTTYQGKQDYRKSFNPMFYLNKIKQKTLSSTCANCKFLQSAKNWHYASMQKAISSSHTQKTMFNQRKQILIIEDDHAQAEYYVALLQASGWHTSLAASCAEALQQATDHEFDVILADIYLPDGSGLELIPELISQQADSHLIAMTSHSSTSLAVEAMRLGAYDYLEKPLSAERLKVSVENAFKHKRLIDFHDTIQRDHFHHILGASLPMQAVFRIIESAAPSDATVFITGESGTGKELCAEALHQQSPRHNAPFIAINCAAIPHELMESEIFGHVKGAFTGATADRKGAATRAHGGTLFLDEICEMDLDLQSKLLRFFQSRRFQAVGAQQETEVDVRIVCATNQDPYEQVRKGLFREDLYYRLHVIPIHLPPLRERDGDVMLIANQLLTQYNQKEKKNFTHFSHNAQQALLNYTWPGNIRELENIIRNIVVLHNGPSIDHEMLPANLHHTEPTDKPTRTTASTATNAHHIKPLWKVELDAIEEAITACDGNIQLAADLLDINPSTIYRKRKKFSDYADD